MNGHTVLYDPEGRIDTQLPLDRVTRERVVRAVLAWSDDYEQVGLLPSGAAHAVAADVRACAGQLPDDDGRRLLAEIALGEADSRLPLRSRNLHRVKNEARILRALYERLDRLQGTAPAAETTAVVSPLIVARHLLPRRLRATRMRPPAARSAPAAAGGFFPCDGRLPPGVRWR
ncbi:restriction endonuclease [Streptomyces sp. NPDC088254]|uniref:restriction endonuclease n=1 Tax=Streptomyces sp. NPDC088254 TaxID=3365847 RepID=UPI00382AD135